MTASSTTTDWLSASPELFEQFVFGLMLVDGDRSVAYLNQRARRLLLPADVEISGSWSCCDLICDRLGPILDGGCLSEMATATTSELPEVRMDIESERLETAAWVTASRLYDEGRPGVLFHLRPGKNGDRRRRIAASWNGQANSRERADLRITSLGRLQIEGADGPIGGEWLEQRPGQLLKYLLCERRRIVTPDQIAEALWPDAELDVGRSRVRYNVHALREKIEPARARRSPARFVVARRGGYVFDTDRVWLDVDEFEREAGAGLVAFEQSHDEQAGADLDRAVRLYRGDFLPDDPYADWAMVEKERLRELAAQALRTQVRISVQRGRLAPAADHTRRLADLEPFDTDVQQLLIEICLRRGRRSEALRRYTQFRRRMLNVFNVEPDFDLIDVERQISRRDRRAGRTA